MVAAIAKQELCAHHLGERGVVRVAGIRVLTQGNLREFRSDTS